MRAREEKAGRTFYCPTAMLGEMEAEARRQDRTVNWIVCAAWKIARDRVRQFPVTKGQT